MIKFKEFNKYDSEIIYEECITTFDKGSTNDWESVFYFKDMVVAEMQMTPQVKSAVSRAIRRMSSKTACPHCAPTSSHRRA